MSYACPDYGLEANGQTMLNATPTWNCKEQSRQTKDIFSIKKLVRSDGCDSKLGKIKKTFTIMAFTSRVLRKTVEDAEIFQVLEESTDSNVTIYSSEEHEGGNESDSDEDGQLDDNSETNKKGGTRTHLH
jgi:hypothetical protein